MSDVPALPFSTDKRPIAGKILGPKGEVLKTVRHGPEELSFGFKGKDKDDEYTDVSS